jgi:hypothetical protein
LLAAKAALPVGSLAEGCCSGFAELVSEAGFVLAKLVVAFSTTAEPGKEIGATTPLAIGFLSAR